MDFIERLLGFSPDGGSGLVEFLLFAVPMCGVLLLSASRRFRKPRL